MGLYICCACCCQAVTSKTLEINLIVLHSIGAALLILSLAFIKWSNLPIINLIFFLILLVISLTCLIFIILIRMWRANNTIKTANKGKGIIFSNLCFGLLICTFICCLIEDIAFASGIRKANYPCYDKVKDHDYYYSYYYKKSSPIINSNEKLRKLEDGYSVSKCQSLGKYYYINVIPYGQRFLGYLTISFLQVLSIIEFILWIILKKRITFGLDTPQPIVPSPTTRYGGTNVVVVQPGDVVYMGGQQVSGPYMYNNNVQYPPQQYMANQVPNSNEYQLRGNAQ